MFSTRWRTFSERNILRVNSYTPADDVAVRSCCRHRVGPINVQISDLYTGNGNTNKVVAIGDGKSDFLLLKQLHLFNWDCTRR